ncbi:carbon-nitrogen family hydrolase [Pseudalkalibacillus caeni]|uniref:Carbon-nitrogen family hydrolase n=1 Tax=Exobacillus caeni TaxID=2574798 RepID=A0A5R9F3N9_9BACL|nr:carbon-nitrogen family hydrolase [Pseudalkalibacillus caeni]TLS38302.1 carbon-nitrogen family hydrolase [Pseudalkalibacillus caeni]
MSLKIALIQYDIVFGNPEKNFRNMESKIEETLENKPDIIVLPELWTTGYDLTRLDEIADKNGEKTRGFISALAKKHRVNIVAGSIAKQKEDKVTNTMLVFNRDGELVHEYSKVHLFRLMDEEKYLISGNTTGAFTLEDVPCAGFICYDIRFPEWIRLHAVEGAKVLFVPAEWPEPRTDHWRSLLISRAIENQCYVVACNRAGRDLANEFAGHSMIIGPWGEIIAESGLEETILYGEIEPEEVEKIRKKIPVFEDRRTDLY